MHKMVIDLKKKSITMGKDVKSVHYVRTPVCHVPGLYKAGEEVDLCGVLLCAGLALNPNPH